MGKVNTWYVIGREDKECCFGYTQITPKGKFYTNRAEAENYKKAFQKTSKYNLFIMKRTCEVLNARLQK